MKITRTEIICKFCGKKFYLPYWRAKDAKFCSQKCHGLANRGVNHFNFRPERPRCKRCNKLISSRAATLCVDCYNKKRIGRVVSSETRKKISESNKGRKPSRESIEKMRKSLLGNIPWNKGRSIFKDYSEKRKHFNNRRKEKRREEGGEYKVADRIRTLIRNSLKYNSKNYKQCKTTKLLGCSVRSFRKHLESQFKDNMSWDNYGEWHIDHIIPVSSYNLSLLSEQKKAFNYSNCQPLWAKDNLRKGSKIPITFSVLWGMK